MESYRSLSLFDLTERVVKSFRRIEGEGLLLPFKVKDDA